MDLEEAIGQAKDLAYGIETSNTVIGFRTVVTVDEEDAEAIRFLIAAVEEGGRGLMGDGIFEGRDVEECDHEPKEDEVAFLIGSVSEDAARIHRLIGLAKALANPATRIILDSDMPRSTVKAAEDLYWLLSRREAQGGVD